VTAALARHGLQIGLVLVAFVALVLMALVVLVPFGRADENVECLEVEPRRTVSGAQDSSYTPTLGSATAVDARKATWVQVADWPVSIEGDASVCWHGGMVRGTYPDTMSWDAFHSTGAVGFANPNSQIEAVRIHNYGDGINVREGASDFVIRGVHETYMHDDCVQNDFLYSGVIEDSLFDGCYVGLSARPTSSNTTSDGRDNTVTLRNSLLRLQPMPTVYDGPTPGHGGFFKWENHDGRSPKLDLQDNVFRVDQEPNGGTLGLPDGYEVSCSGNTIVWLGEGDFPDADSWEEGCPDTRIVTTPSIWDDAVATWAASHEVTAP
jgi:hypothetical protein